MPPFHLQFLCRPPKLKTHHHFWSYHSIGHYKLEEQLHHLKITPTPRLIFSNILNYIIHNNIPTIAIILQNIPMTASFEPFLWPYALLKPSKHNYPLWPVSGHFAHKTTRTPNHRHYQASTATKTTVKPHYNCLTWYPYPSDPFTHEIPSIFPPIWPHSRLWHAPPAAPIRAH